MLETSRYIKNIQTVVLQYIVWKTQNTLTYVDVSSASLQINNSKDYKAIMSWLIIISYQLIFSSWYEFLTRMSDGLCGCRAEGMHEINDSRNWPQPPKVCNHVNNFSVSTRLTLFIKFYLWDFQFRVFLTNHYSSCLLHLYCINFEATSWNIYEFSHEHIKLWLGPWGQINKKIWQKPGFLPKFVLSSDLGFILHESVI